MTPQELRDAPAPPALGPAVQALWWATRGDWDRAHECAQSAEGEKAADWVHAYLHRVEGDPGNARYWYGQAGQQVPQSSLDQEWQSIASALLG